MRYFYAIMNLDVCVGMIDTFAKINEPNYIGIPEYDETIIGKRWNGTVWEIVYPESVQ